MTRVGKNKIWICLVRAIKSMRSPEFFGRLQHGKQQGFNHVAVTDHPGGNAINAGVKEIQPVHPIGLGLFNIFRQLVEIYIAIEPVPKSRRTSDTRWIGK